VEDPGSHEDINLPTIDAVIELLSRPLKKAKKAKRAG
jgi:hypothetical protein